MRRKKTPIRPRKRPLQRRAQETVQAILQATAQLLIKEGYEALSTNRVAERAGVSIGSLYQYFPNKEALLAALIDRHLEEVGQVVQHHLPLLIGVPIAQAVPRMVRLMVELHQQDPRLHRALFSQLPGEAFLSRRDRLEASLRGLIEAYLLARGVPSERVALTAFFAVTVVENLTHAAVLERPQALADPHFIDEVSRLVVPFLEGACAPLRSAPSFG